MQDPILSGLPYVVIFFTAFFSGIWADKLINRAYVSATIVRKIMQGVGKSACREDKVDKHHSMKLKLK